MAYRAKVRFKASAWPEQKYIGVKALTQKPVKNGRVQFEHEGKLLLGRIVVIVPENWEARGDMPLIDVAAGDGEP
jgi:hypothetical protein